MLSKEQMSKLMWLPILILTASVACTEKGKPFAEHEPTRVISPDGNEVTAVDPAVTNPAAPTLQIMDLKQLADRVLSPARIADGNSYVARDVQDELIIFNRRLLEASNKETPEFKAMLKRVQTAMMSECQGFLDGCRGIRYFSRAPSSADIAKLIAKNDPPNYLKFILLSLKLRPRVWDPEIPKLLMNRPTKTLTAEETKFANAIHSLLEVTLLTARQQMTDPKVSRTFLEETHAWHFLNDADWNMSGPTSTALFEMLAQSGMLYDQQGRLHPDTAAVIAAMNADPNGIMQKQRLLKGQNIGTAGAKPFTETDDLLFLLDAVFTRKISAAGGAELFASSKRSLSDLEKASENYLRLQFLASLQESTAMAQKIYATRVRSDELFTFVRKESASIARVWQTFKAFSAPLRDFTILASRVRSKAIDQVDHEQAIRNLFESIDKSIVISSVYPQELVLVHRLSQTRQRITMKTTDDRFLELDSKEIMKTLFEGKLAPFLQYGNVGGALNQYELIYAFDFAVRSNLFNVSGIDVDMFMADTLHQLEEGSMTKISNTIDQIEFRFNKSANYSAFKEACREFQDNGRPQPRRIYIGELTYSPYFGKLTEAAFTALAPSNQNTATAGNSENGGVWYMGADYAEALEMARLDLGNGIRIGQAMLASYSSYLQQTGASAADILQKTKRTQAEVASYAAKRNELIDASKRWNDDIGFCYWKALNRDFQMREQVIRTEMAYLREVYGKIQRLRDPKISDQEATALTNSIQFRNLPSGFTGQDRISKDGYLYSTADLLLRVRGYLKQGLPGSGIAPLAPQLTVEIGPNLNNDSEFIKNSVQGFIPMTGSEDDFVYSGLRRLFANGSPINWLALKNNAISNWGVSIRSAVSLHRLEYEVRGTALTAPTTEILGTHEEILRWSNFTEMDRLLAKVLARQEKVNPLMFDSRILKFESNSSGKVSAYWGMYDYPLKLAQAEEIGFVWVANENPIDKGVSASDLPIRQTYMKAGRTYFTTRAKAYRGLTVLPYNPDLDAKLDASMKRFVRTEVAAAESFTNDLNARVQLQNQLPASQRPHFDYNFYSTISDPLVDMNLENTFRDKVDQFNQATANCYANGAAPCQDFAP